MGAHIPGEEQVPGGRSDRASDDYKCIDASCDPIRRWDRGHEL